MKILFLCNLVPNKRGSFEAWLVALGRHCTAKGDRLIVVCAAEPQSWLAREFDEAGVEWDVINGWTAGQGQEHAWRFVLPAVRLVRRHRPDVCVVHFGNELPCLAARMLAGMVGIRGTRWVWQQHQQVADPIGLARVVSRLGLLGRVFDHFTAVYEGGRRSLRLRGIANDKISVIANSIEDYSLVRPPGWFRKDLGSEQNAVLLIAVGWLVPRKRVEFLLAALAGVIPQCRVPVRLVVVGEGPERSNLEREARRLGIAPHVHFLGQRQDVRELLAEADILVHAALAETCTYAVTESMAAAIPAVVTEAGAAREQIDSGRTGVVCGPSDLDGFIAAVAVLVNDKDRRRQIGTAARDRWRERFEMRNAILAYHDLYTRLARGARG